MRLSRRGMRLSAGIAHHAEKEKSLSFEMESVCPAGTVACSLPVILAAYAAGGGSRDAQDRKKRGLSFEIRLLCPAGTVACSLPVILAAYAAGGKAGPVMGLRPLLGPPCIPPEAPPSGFQFP